MVRGRPLDADSHQRILDATLALLGQRGASGWSVSEVARSAGVGKATVYRHWADKDALILDVLQRTLLQRVPVPHTGSLRGDLTAVYESQLAFAGSPEGAALIRYLVHEAARDERFAAVFREALLGSRDAASTMVDRAIARGEVAPEVDRELLWEVLPGSLMLRLVTGDPLPGPERASLLVDQVLRGFAIGEPPVL